MYVKQFCLILSLAFICLALEDIDSTVEVAVISEDQDVTKNVFHLGRCTLDSDCHNSGRCEVGAGGKFCKCKSGTSGDYCEVVDECVGNALNCSTKGDVYCVFDVQKEKAVCKCANENKTYVEDEGRCMSPCVKDSDCGQYGYCEHEVDGKKFCACNAGVSGDYCDILDECHNKVVDCGVNNNATCTINGKGKGYCKCDDRTKGFDYDEKICKGCEGCGENSNGYGCMYRDGIRRCSCKLRYYSSENGTCEDCKCGPDSYGCQFTNGTKTCKCWSGAAHKDGYCHNCKCGLDSYGCQFTNGTKVCQCLLGAAYKDGSCQKCDCGSRLGVSNCEFKDSKKICTCKDGYALAGTNGPCKQMCNATNPCVNGGKCVQNFCNCLKGTSGDFCNTIDACNGQGKCGSAKCLYNVTSNEAYCKCDGSLAFDDYSKTCKECSCGSYSRSCGYVNGKKTCNCLEAYADRLGRCELCFCKGYSSMYGCKFDVYGSMKCRCLKGFAQTEDECRECDCGDHGQCNFNGWRSKYCNCDEGYSENKGKCEACDCGKKGSCHFDYNGKKNCYCDSGFKEYQGTCKACDCGKNAICEFNKFGSATCSCQKNYGMKNGICTLCNCDPGTSCKFNTYNLKKVCICPKGYIDNKGKCSFCDCEVENSTCTFAPSGFNRCKCPEGYEEKNHPTAGFRKICDKIDVCRNSDPCPPSSTKCVNGKLGKYECVCKPGYEALYADVERRGCQDIDECVRNYKPCDDEDATCVNTPGSYRCDCRAGYIRKAAVEKNNVCHVDFSGSASRPWRTASIIVGVFAAIIIIGLLMAICQKYGSD